MKEKQKNIQDVEHSDQDECDMCRSIPTPLVTVGVTF